jgi:sigma-B regulation protein RsbU (phosphoserine phosphatase)
MNPDTLAYFRQKLSQHRDALMEWLNTDSPYKDIHLGTASTQDVLQIISELKKALEQIDERDFGQCVKGDGEVEVERLELDYTTCVCLAHYSDSQLRALENELELAAKVQRGLLPAQVKDVKGLGIAARTQPAHIIGGDYYDFFDFQDGTPGFAIADVMGKGLPASMLMSNLQASLRILASDYSEPHLLLSRLNQLFRYNLKLIRFISVFLLAIDVGKRTIRYANAGHHPPTLWNAAQKSITWLNPTGPAIGLNYQMEYTSERVSYASGDVLLMYTDGLVEARSADGEEFGDHRLEAYLKEHYHESPQQLVKGLFETLKSYAGSFSDDITLLVVKAE